MRRPGNPGLSAAPASRQRLREAPGKRFRRAGAIRVALADGGVAIIDYKTGRIDRPAQWFDERPRSPQLGMYALAERETHPELATRAVAYAQLCPGAVAPAGRNEALALAGRSGRWSRGTLVALGSAGEGNRLARSVPVCMAPIAAFSAAMSITLS